CRWLDLLLRPLSSARCQLQAGMWIDHIVMIGSIPKDRLVLVSNSLGFKSCW
ncbi:Os01g0258000, partial [Oryza sativa Japonica Group]